MANTDKVRVRWGTKSFLNLGVFITYVPEDTFNKISEYFTQIKVLLAAAGNTGIADSLLWERS